MGFFPIAPPPEAGFARAPGDSPKTHAIAEPAAVAPVPRAHTFAMGFDKDDTRPVVDVSKRSTKINIGMIVGVLIFFVLAGIVLWALWLDPSAATEPVPTP